MDTLLVNIIKPWQISEERYEKLERLASYIIGTKAMKLINEACEEVFENDRASNNGTNDPGNKIKRQQQIKLIHGR